MITKDRLKELIEQEATVYEVKYQNINPVSLTNKVRFISDKNKVIVFEPRPDEKYLHHKYFKNLFETKEEAEWHKEFGNITRTESLELPTWKEFSNRVRNITFKADPYDYYCYTNGRYVEIKEYYYRGYNNGDRVFFSKPLTKENYYEACRKCKELFLGGENGRQS